MAAAIPDVRRPVRVGAKQAARTMLATTAAPPTTVAATCTSLPVVCGPPGASFGASPATTDAAP